MTDTFRRAMRRPPLTGRRGPLAVVAAAVAIFVVCGLYGIASPFLAGHYGYHGGEYSTRARNTLRHGSLLPVNTPTFYSPTPAQLYLHHPVLTHHLVTVTMGLFGDQEWAVRLAALIASTVSLGLLALLGWRWWGPAQAAAMSVTFVLVPINLWYGNHIDPGYPSIAAFLGLLLGYLSWIDTGRWTAGAFALLCGALSGGFEWSPFLAVVPVGVHALHAGLTRRGRYLAFVPLLVSAMLVPLVAHGAIVWSMGHVPEMLEGWGVRTQGGLDTAFYARTWEHAVAMFSLPLLLVFLAWLALVSTRLAAGRGVARDLVGVSFAFAFLAYIHLIRQGALLHAYRYLYGGVACAIAVAELSVSVGRYGARLRGWSATTEAALAAVTATVILAATLPASTGALVHSRLVNGSPFLEPYDAETAKPPFATLVHNQSAPGDILYVHPSFDYQMETVYYLDRDLRRSAAADWLAMPPGQRLRALVLCKPASMRPDERAIVEELVHEHPSWLVAGFLLIDLRRAGADLRAGQPDTPASRTAWARFLDGPYPHLGLKADPAADYVFRQDFHLQ